MTEAPTISTVGRTAFAVSLARAIESERVDRWFDDPLARYLADVIPEAATTQVGDRIGPWVSIRTRFLDELVAGAFARGVRQVIIVGAGLDARAFRLEVPSDATFFEVDREDVLAGKRTLLAAAGLSPAAGRSEIVVDVLQPDWLAEVAAAGWDRARPTLWILEGFLIYFDPDTRARLVRELGEASAPGSELGATVSARGGSDEHPLWHSFEGSDTEAWFAHNGWIAEATPVERAAEEYGRPLAAGEREQFDGVLVAAHLAG
jgi:methyltransferase (TIGR00027 family)